MLPIEELFISVFENPLEEARLELVKQAIRRPEEVLSVLAKRVGGDVVPDTIIVRTAVENVLATLAYKHAQSDSRPLRVIAPSEPISGWQPLRLLLEDYQVRGLIHVYEVPMKPTVRTPARLLASKVARIVRGVSARTVDVTDAPPFIVASLYSAGVRQLTMLVYIEHTKTIVFQKFGYTTPAY